MGKTRVTRREQYILFMILAAAPAVAADDTSVRLENAVDVMNTMTATGHGIRPEQRAAADCVAVIPGFKKGAAVVGVGFGRGFISCRNGSGWSAPAAMT
jgi:SH3 domain-containing YSC84-like protein 1